MTRVRRDLSQEFGNIFVEDEEGNRGFHAEEKRRL